MLKSTPTELWLAVPGYEGYYEVSDQGRVRSVDRVITRRDGRTQRNRSVVLTPGVDTQGRRVVCLRTPGTRETVRVHVLVLCAFVGSRPPGMDGCHWDDDSAHNWLENLRWDTRSANSHDAVRNGKHPMTRRESCPLDHLLIAPNLIAHLAAKTRRGCLACKRAKADRAQAVKHGLTLDFRAAAGKHYAQIMAGTALGAMQDRVCCLRKHRLVAPNLVPSALADGRRGCLACQRALGKAWRARRDGRPAVDVQADSDRQYAHIMRGVSGGVGKERASGRSQRPQAIRRDSRKNRRKTQRASSST